MKTLSAKLFCCSCKLYKLGLLIGFTYLIPNLLIVVLCFGSGYNDYTLPLMCALTVLTSALLIKGLMQERHEYLLPWLGNIAVLIVFNIILVTVQFGELNREETKNSFYLELAFFICLELQILCWYYIYCLLEKGYQNKKLLTSPIGTISKTIQKQDKDYYKINLIANENLGSEKKVISV